MRMCMFGDNDTGPPMHQHNDTGPTHQHMQPLHKVSIAAMELCDIRGLYGVRMVLCVGSRAVQNSTAWRCVAMCNWLYRRYVELSDPM
jgi:hypothetical protein